MRVGVGWAYMQEALRQLALSADLPQLHPNADVQLAWKVLPTPPSSSLPLSSAALLPLQGSGEVGRGQDMATVTPAR